MKREEFFVTADGHSGDVLFARKLAGSSPDVVSRILGDTSDVASYEFEVAILSKVKGSGYRATYRNWIFS